MIDFHSHILPGIDDGSASVEESVRMLRLSYQQGVDKIVATPHFYATKEPPEIFLKRRAKSWELLSTSMPKDVPDVYLGAEVYYYIGISHCKELYRLCIGNTNILMLEMPFQRWNIRMLDDVVELASNSDVTVLLAHIDRYLSSQPSDVWNKLLDNGVLFQVNASFFLKGIISRYKAFDLLRKDMVTVLGSDCHNTLDRMPNMGSAYAVIQKKFGGGMVCKLNKRAEDILIGRFRIDEKKETNL